jgi:hypothetical protein
VEVIARETAVVALRFVPLQYMLLDVFFLQHPRQC